MSIPDFVYWLRLFRAHFPNDSQLSVLGIEWYPGAPQLETDVRLDLAREVGSYSGYHVFVSNSGIIDGAGISVCVQGEGEAVFRVGSSIDLEKCWFGFNERQLDDISDLLSAHREEIVLAWERFRAFAKPIRDRRLAALDEVSAA